MKKRALPERKRDKIAILGFTEHGYQAPWGNPEWDFFGLNDLHGIIEQCSPGIFQTDQIQWFQLHQKDSQGQYPGARDPEHTAWLAQQTCPVFMFHHDPAVPACVVYPIREVLNLTHPETGALLWPERYFNNSISWMIALAILQGYTTIGLYGVDMAMDGVHGESEYSHQRPSVEFMIGVARGLGITVLMPQESELLKCGYLYAWDNVSHTRKKWLTRLANLEQAEAECVAAYESSKKVMFIISGAIQLLTGQTGPKLKFVTELFTEEQRKAALAILEVDQSNAANENEAAKRSLHETRGAINNCKWSLRNYLPGEGPIQDVPRTERSLVLEDVASGPAASDGKSRTVAGGINRLLELQR